MDVKTVNEGHRIRKLAKVLSDAGQQVPDELASAIAYSGFQLNTASGTAAAWSKVATANTEKSFQSAYASYAQATAVDRAVNDSGVMEAVTQAKHARLLSAVHDAQADIFNGLCVAFNAKADDFSSAVETLPDISNVYVGSMADGMWGLNSKQFGALGAARQTADVLNTYWKAYRTVATILGHYDESKSEYTDYLTDVFMLGVPERFRDADSVGEKLFGLHRGAEQLAGLKPIAPYVLLTDAGIPLQLKHPGEAMRLRQLVQFGVSVRDEVA